MDFKSFLTEATEKTETVVVPAGHEVGMKVPKGGSSCAVCKWHDEKGNTCGNKYWVKWHKGDNKIPAAADSYCCDYYED